MHEIGRLHRRLVPLPPPRRLILPPVTACPCTSNSCNLLSSEMNPTHSSDDQIHLNQVDSRQYYPQLNVQEQYKLYTNCFVSKTWEQAASQCPKFHGKLSLELSLLYITTIQPPEHDLNKKYATDRQRFKTGLFHTCIHLVYEPGQMLVMWPAASCMTAVKSWQCYRIFCLAITHTLALKAMWGYGNAADH